jgi:hypothetical protein
MEPYSGIREECARYAAELTVGPLSPEERERLLFVRRTSAYPRPGPERERWNRLLCRFHALFPNTYESEMWHEAGHAVVAHVLGCGVERIARSAENVPGFEPKPRPQGWRDRDEATIAVAGWLAEARYVAPALTEPTDEVARFVRGLTLFGEPLSTEDRLQLVLRAEHRATAILAEHWDAVERIGIRGMAGLPIEHDELLTLLEPAPVPD